jgi:hypothetical protein
MNPGVNPANPLIVSAFRSALIHQWGDRRGDLPGLAAGLGMSQGRVTARPKAGAALQAMGTRQ